MASPHRLEVISNHLRGFTQLSTKRTSSGKYQYTLDNNNLTNEQRAFYEENGYLIIRKLIDHKILDECRDRFIDICNGIADAGQIIIMKEKKLLNSDAKGEYLINKFRDILFDDVFKKYVTNPSLLKYVECFTGPNITGFHSQFINKPPSKGNEPSVHPMHQDLYYFPIRPTDRMVTTWTAIEKVTVDNGCLFVVPGSHKNILQHHDYPKDDVNHMFYEIKGFDSLPRVHLEMNKGDTVFFHPLLFHGSGPNITKVMLGLCRTTLGFRKAMSSHYAFSNCQFLENSDANQDFMKEVQKAAKLKTKSLSHREIFQLNQMLIKGEPGILQQL